MRVVAQYLIDLQEQVANVSEFTHEGKAEFFRNKLIQFGVIRCYELIGEIVKRLPDTLLAKYPDVEWKEIKGMRDFLIHRYSEVRLEPIWEAVTKLPTLKTAVEAMLRESTDENPPPGT